MIKVWSGVISFVVWIVLSSCVTLGNTVSHDSSANRFTASGHTPLILAVEQNDLALVERLLDQGASPNKGHQMSNATPLHFAASNVSGAEIVRFLLSNGANPNARNVMGSTPLHFAINEEITRLLVSRGANPSTVDSFGTTPVYSSVFGGDVASASFLLDKGSGSSQPQDKHGHTILMYAILSENRNVMVPLVLQYDWIRDTINYSDQNGETALYKAVSKEELDLAKKLIEHGADPNYSTINGYTPLMWAGRHGVKFVEFLISSGANVDAQDASGNSAIFHAVTFNYSNEVLEHLIAAGANVDLTNIWHETVVHEAISRLHNEALVTLLRAGANPMVFSEGVFYDGTPLQVLISKYWNDLKADVFVAANELIKHGAYVNTQNAMGRTILMAAIKYNDENIVRSIYRLGANPDIRDAFNNSVDYYASDKTLCQILDNCTDTVVSIETSTTTNTSKGLNLFDRSTSSSWPFLSGDVWSNMDADKLVLLLKSHDVHALSSNNLTAIMIAASLVEDTAVIDLLISAGANVNDRNEHGLTTLMYSAGFNSNPEIIARLLAAGAEVNERSNSGSTALHYAAEFNENPEVLDLLINAGADIRTRDRVFEVTPLMAAASNNKNAMVIERLIYNGADVDARDSGGMTALMFAAEANDNPEILDHLIVSGANVDARDKTGSTALIKASRFNNNPLVVELLLRNGANTNNRLADGRTALMFAVQAYEDSRIIDLFVEAGAAIDARDDMRITSLMYAAASNQNPLIIDRLIALGSDVNALSAHEYTALTYAVANNKNPEIVDRLISSGANVNERFDLGHTALMVATRLDKHKIVEMLIEAGADVDAQEFVNGWTPLMFAARHSKSPEIIETLIAAGSNIKVEGRQGLTAWDIIQTNDALVNTDVYWRLNDLRF